MKKTMLVLFALLAAARIEAADYSAELNRLLSRLQSMGHGSYTDAEWNEALSSLDQIAAKAAQAGDWNGAVEANVIKATVYSDMRHDYSKALSILEDTKTQYGGHRASAMKKVYVREADTYARLGDESAVQRVIQEFEASPYYDEESYSFKVGEGRDTPLTIMRPSAGAGGSISVTAMNVSRRQSQYSVGSLFPSFNVVDIQGRELTRDDFQGRVLLVDFWARDWTPWKRDLDNLRSLYARYQDAGFRILGISLEPDAVDLKSFAERRHMAWPQVAGEKNLPKTLGIFGEATNFLIDRSGVIIGRDLHGADLVAAVKQALGSQ